MSEPVVEPTTPVAEPTAPVAEPAAINYQSMINEDGTFGENFLSSLPDDIGNHSAISKYGNVVDLVKGTINASSLVGKKAEEFWKSEEPEIVAKRREIMGMPSDIASYELVKPELPDDIPYDEGRMDAFKQIAYEAGITPEQANKLIEWDANSSIEAFGSVAQQMQEARDSAEAELKGEWGSKFQYNLGKVKQATDFLGITEELESTGLGNNPTVLKMVLDKLVPAISDDKLIEGTKADNYATIQDELVEIESKLTAMDRSDPAGKALVARRLELLQKMG